MDTAKYKNSNFNDLVTEEYLKLIEPYEKH